MKIFSILLFTILSLQAFAEKINLQSLTILNSKYDSTIASGYSVLKFVIYNAENNQLFKNVQVNLNVDTLLGISNSKGELECIINNPGFKRLCFDTPKGNSLIRSLHHLKSQFRYTIKVSVNNYNHRPEPISVKKPVIYLYPTQTTEINIQVKPRGDFTFTYPKYFSGGWQVTAKPNGDISHNGRLYSYLFWEGESTIINEIDQNAGFIVNADTVVQFLENTLTTVGLTSKEQADFITFWAPILEQNKLNFIHFEFNNGYDKYISNMEITPKPDTKIRVFMTFKAINNTYNSVTPQIIPTYKRKGFTVVEWGGSELDTTN